MRRNSPSSKKTSEEAILLFKNDLEILNTRIFHLTGVKYVESIVDSPSHVVSSSFVSGIRRQTEEKKYTEVETVEKLHILERILSKIIEYDREILRKTTPKVSKLEAVRRKSNGGELLSIPTHLTITDRLLDLYDLSQRMESSRNITSNDSKSLLTKVPESTEIKTGRWNIIIVYICMQKNKCLLHLCKYVRVDIYI